VGNKNHARGLTVDGDTVAEERLAPQFTFDELERRFAFRRRATGLDQAMDRGVDMDGGFGRLAVIVAGGGRVAAFLVQHAANAEGVRAVRLESAGFLRLTPGFAGTSLFVEQQSQFASGPGIPGMIFFQALNESFLGLNSLAS